MKEAELTSEILASTGFEPCDDQVKAVSLFSGFMLSADPKAAMLLCGSAGTGKTSIASAIVRTLHRLGQKTVLLAPTGRAAKVFSLNAGFPANTIHRKIYRQRTFEGIDTAFGLAENRLRNTLFIVDEASMVPNQLTSAADIFGSGCLLDDLIQFVYSGVNCRLMLVGDKAQLPPVGCRKSPALEAEVLEMYGLNVVFANMDEVLRQSESSGILFNATAIRRIITSSGGIRLPRIRLKNFTDVKAIRGSELIEALCSSYAKAGLDGTMVVSRSNKTANIYNKGIRSMILGREAELTTGDRIMVVKNNYHWTELANKTNGNAASGRDNGRSPADTEQLVPSFLANGDVAIVRKARHFTEMYGFHFADATLAFPDYDNYEIEAKLLLDSLYSESPSLSREQQQALFNGVLGDYSHIKRKPQRMKAVREDPYYNALQVKFAYAVTCHKAQGGQWEHVYIDQGFMSEAMINEDYIHWLYTAFTRATQQLYLVNWRDSQKE